MTAFGTWLRETRRRQTSPDGTPWSQDYFLDQLEQSTGWRLKRGNYSPYETGKVQNPKPETVERFVRFWTDRGEPGPSPVTPPAPVLDPMERIAAAVESIARNLELLRTDMAGQSGATIGAVQTLGAQLTSTLAGMRAEP